jgi:ATP-dependent DNA helicase DinG
MARIADGVSRSHVLWTEKRGRGISVGASPIDVGDIMREELFYRTPATVLTSATLSTAGSFGFIKRRLGMDFEPREEVLPSPFDYEEQALLYMPEDMPDPRDGAYLEAATHQVVELVRITGGGAFVLCTSLRVMRELHKRCGTELEHKCLMQGEAPKNRLLDQFRADGNAVLFATSTFWEGVDVPGDALRLVIIDKLPFDVPTDPLVAARCERIKEQGEQPFMKYLVPSAALSLKQGFGRLIRSKRDRGIVAILDGRLLKKGYGKVFLRSLPPARRSSSLADARAFWDGLGT